MNRAFFGLPMAITVPTVENRFPDLLAKTADVTSTMFVSTAAARMSEKKAIAIVFYQKIVIGSFLPDRPKWVYGR